MAVRVFIDSLAEWTGLEPATPGVTGRYSNQLNYHSFPAAGPVLALQQEGRIIAAFAACATVFRRAFQTRSKIPAAPMPVPMHMVTMPYFSLGSRWKACTSVAVRTAPVAPSG